MLISGPSWRIRMRTQSDAFPQQINFTRYHHQPQGHYESFFQRANHPSRPLAFWIRYTIFSPRNRPQDATGELWAVFFNGETNQHVTVKHEVPLDQCTFRSSAFFAQIGEATLQPGRLSGMVRMQEDTIAWEFIYHSDEKPLLLLPSPYYQTRLPAAKSLVGVPLATYTGSLVVNGETITVEKWKGSQNHNWGSKHTDRYAWGQVAGFDTSPESFLEIATVRLKMGPIWTPSLTLLVLRHEGEEFALNSLPQSLRAQGRFDYFTWDFRSKTRDVAVQGTISAPRAAFVGLRYANPPGGEKYCLNTKLASCELRLKRKHKPTEELLLAQNRAAFEILTEDASHGIQIRA